MSNAFPSRRWTESACTYRHELIPRISLHASQSNSSSTRMLGRPYCTQIQKYEQLKLRDKEIAKMDKKSKDKSTVCTNLIQRLARDIIGEKSVFHGPFGPRKCVYMDQTASGRSIKSIEDFIGDNVLPIYGNTHTTTSYYASQISAYRDESREIIKKSCGGGHEDEVVFCGSGATAGVHKLVHAIKRPGEPSAIIFVGPFEHHSNILPWRESSDMIVNIPEDDYGTLDVKYLEHKLHKLKNKKECSGRLFVGVFSAASNVTGALTDDYAVTVLMHKYGGFAFWDYAAAAPHVKICMNPETDNKGSDKLAQKDALFFSGHKFIGGPQTTGVLVAKKHVFRNPVPHGHGGGTVLFVTKKDHQYLKEIHEREEGGTPEIVGSIRLGLVFQLKNAIGDNNIIAREAYYTRKTLAEWKKIPQIKIIGPDSSPRVPIVSFMIQHPPSGYFLHHDFVVALLNDLFGIQCRGGCMCAGPYSQGLLGIGEVLAVQYENILAEERKPVNVHEEPEYDVIFKPGFVRISLPFHSSEQEIQFVIDAVKFIAVHAWKLLPFYVFNAGNGCFRFHAHDSQTQTISKPLSSFRLRSSTLPKLSFNIQPQEYFLGYENCINYAKQMITQIIPELQQCQMEDDEQEFLPVRKPFRWFMLPSEALAIIQDGYPTKHVLEATVSSVKSNRPFKPKDNYKTRSLATTKTTWSEGSIPHQLIVDSCWADEELTLKHEQSRLARPSKLRKLFRKGLRLEKEGDKKKDWENSSNDSDDDEDIDTSNDEGLMFRTYSNSSSGFEEH